MVLELCGMFRRLLFCVLRLSAALRLSSSNLLPSADGAARPARSPEPAPPHLGCSHPLSGVALIEGDSSRAERITLCLLVLLLRPALPRLNRDTICWLELARSRRKTKHDF
ncbi:uncharacterized [Tachysurus ichikawai]